MSQPVTPCWIGKCKTMWASCSLWEEGRDQTSSFPHRHKCSLALNLPSGLRMNYSFRRGQCHSVGQKCGWTDFRSALFQKICLVIFCPPFPGWLQFQSKKIWPWGVCFNCHCSGQRILAIFGRLIAKILLDAKHRFLTTSYWTYSLTYLSLWPL